MSPELFYRLNLLIDQIIKEKTFVNVYNITNNFHPKNPITKEEVAAFSEGVKEINNFDFLKRKPEKNDN